MNVKSPGASSRPKYVIGSGWWCGTESVNPRRKLLGDESIRSRAFFHDWLSALERNADPYEIVVVDSNSPTKPDGELRETVRWIELPFNAKHSTDHVGRWSGWTRSVLMSGQYALAAEAEYFVYVEQDCLIEGEGIIEFCISSMTKGLMFGDGKGTPQPIQQSFFIVRRDALAPFLANLAALNDPDSSLSPEWKFVFASWRPFVVAANLGLLRQRRMRGLANRLARRLCYDMLPVRSGRVRPIPWGDRYYYFQHATADELEHFRVRPVHSRSS